MAEITVKFDPNNIFTSAEFMRRTKLSATASRSWLYRNSAKLPPPLFTINLGTEAKPMTYMVWTPAQGNTIVRIYHEQRRKRLTAV